MPTRVLVVDDSPTIRRVVSAVLERHGFEVVQAVDGQDALEHLHQSRREAESGDVRPIDLVLVDFVMPRMNGFQLCRAIRGREELRAMPVVLMSAKSDRIRDHFVQQTGAIDAITKPFDAKSLIAVIENAIRRAQRWGSDGLTGAADAIDGVDGAHAPVAPSSGSVARVALSGDLSIIPIGAILQLLQIEAQSGVLVVTGQNIEVTIIIRQGLIDLVQARGAGLEFRLGRYFVELGLVTPDDIDRLLGNPHGVHAASGSGRKLLGNLLVDAGRVTTDQLRDALSRQSSELVYDVLRWPGGRFEFRHEPAPALAESARLGLPVASAVMEGFRRVDEWRLVETSLGSLDSILQTDPAAAQAVSSGELTPSEHKLLQLVDGRRTVRAIVEESHMSSFDACKVLYQLVEAHLVRRRAD